MHSFKNVLLQKAKDGTVLLKMVSWLLSQEQIKPPIAEKRAKKNKSSFWVRRAAVV